MGSILGSPNLGKLLFREPTIRVWRLFNTLNGPYANWWLVGGKGTHSIGIRVKGSGLLGNKGTYSVGTRVKVLRFRVGGNEWAILHWSI